MRTDYLIPSRGLTEEGRRIVSEDSFRRSSELETLDGKPFLLIVRTRRIVTAAQQAASSAGYSEIPAYSRLLQLPWSIVTAAVYRGLASRLRPKANLSA